MQLALGHDVVFLPSRLSAMPSIGLATILLLLVLVVSKELAGVVLKPRSRRVDQVLSAHIIPLLVVGVLALLGARP